MLIRTYSISIKHPHRNLDSSGLMSSSFRNMPPSFKGADGKIVYSLEARLTRSMRLDQTDLAKITFVPTVDWNEDPKLSVGVKLLYTFSTHRLSKCVSKFNMYSTDFPGLSGATTRVQG